MDFTDIHTIIIGEEGEYGRRLVRYLENHLSPSMHVYQFTTVEGVLDFKGKADIHLLEERLFYGMPEEQKEFFKQEKCKLILLTCKEGEEGFCKYHNPEELLNRITGILSERTHSSEQVEKNKQTEITMIYSPIYEEKLLKIARSFMRPGNLYLGVEDLGYREKGYDSKNNSDMGDLCYYIHLREENILSLLKGMVVRTDEIEVLPSPDMYFYLRELTREDYMWFFDKVKKESKYREVFLGAGNGFVANLDVIRYFDRIILIDSRKNSRQTLFCNRLEKIMNVEELGQEAWKRVYREDILNGSVR